MDEGILIYAHNNELIDYAMMAYCCALLAKHHLHRPVCLATDHETWTDFKTHRNRIDVFDDIKILEEFDYRKSDRRAYGGRHDQAYYHNKTRDTAYQITPFDKTLVLDADYLILDNRLQYIWDMEQPMMANRRTVNVSEPMFGPIAQYVSDMSIPLYWATVFYFEKPQEKVENFFVRWKHVTGSFAYYSQVYNFRSAMYRNDFAFSVAEHAAADYDYTGPFEREPFCKPFPVPYILTSEDTDEVIDIDNSGVLLEMNRYKTEIPCKVTSSFHCMNKISLQKNLPKIVELYE